MRGALMNSPPPSQPLANTYWSVLSHSVCVGDVPQVKSIPSSAILNPIGGLMQCVMGWTWLLARSSVIEANLKPNNSLNCEWRPKFVRKFRRVTFYYACHKATCNFKTLQAEHMLRPRSCGLKSKYYDFSPSSRFLSIAFGWVPGGRYRPDS